jgi:hypothetical protein
VQGLILKDALQKAGYSGERIANDDRKIKVRILSLAFLGFLLSVKSDRYFPLPEHLPEPLFQLFLIPYTCLFFAAFIIFIKPEIIGDMISFLDHLSAIRLTTAIIVVFEAMALVLLGVQDIRYASFGYQLNIPLTAILFTLIGITLVFLLVREVRPDILVYSALASYTGTYLLSIISFPLHPQRSDMLPLMVSGGQSFLSGVTPYGYHFIPQHQIFTYLPGMWMAYLPAVAFSADPRFINLGCMVISVLILAYCVRDSHKFALLLLPVFILTPYLQYRHEIYLGVLFLVLSIVFALCSRNRWLESSVAAGYALSVYQFTWVLFPFGVVAAFRKWGIKKAGIGLLTSVALALIIILPFFLTAPADFIKGVYGNWLYIDTPTVNLFYYFSLLVPWNLMVVIQGIVMAIILAVGLRKMDPVDCWGWMATALVVFIALNRVINQYFYLIVLFLLVMHGISTGTTPETTD